MTDYTKMTDAERKEALWNFTWLNVRAKQKRAILKDATPDCSAAEYKQALKDIGEDIKLNNAEIKRLLKSAGAA